MSYTDQELNDEEKYRIEMQRKIKTGEITAVGFYVDKKRYADMERKAKELWTQTQPTKGGGEERLLNSPDPNHYVNFCVNFFEQNYGIMRQFMNAKDPRALVKNLFGQLMNQMGTGNK